MQRSAALHIPLKKKKKKTNTPKTKKKKKKRDDLACATRSAAPYIEILKQKSQDS